MPIYEKEGGENDEILMAWEKSVQHIFLWIFGAGKWDREGIVMPNTVSFQLGNMPVSLKSVKKIYKFIRGPL